MVVMVENIKFVMEMKKSASTCCHVEWQQISHVGAAEKKKMDFQSKFLLDLCECE